MKYVEANLYEVKLESGKTTFIVAGTFSQVEDIVLEILKECVESIEKAQEGIVTCTTCFESKGI